MGHRSNIYPRRRLPACLLLPVLVFAAALGQTPTQATVVPLVLPAGVAYDGAGNLFLSESSTHRVLRVSPQGVLTTVAGTGTQGFGGDGGPATAALLDTPTGLAFSPSGSLYVADTHNHAIRRIDPGGTIFTVLKSTELNPTFVAVDVGGNIFFADSRNHLVRRWDAASGALSTVAGDGTEGFAGDGGAATAASLDSPSGIAVDAAGNVFVADSRNHRIRRIDAITRVISTIAGTGSPGYSGDLGDAGRAGLNLPQGLSVDAGGNLLLADRQNHRVRRIDAVTHQITTVAGDGTQGFAGDGGPAVAASLNEPRAVALAPGALPTLADSGNGRVRQVDENKVIRTVAGLGVTAPGTLELRGASTVQYGTGSVTATLLASPATGTVTFLEGGQTVATRALAGNVATLSTALLGAGVHRLTATYGGDAGHAAAGSAEFVLGVSPVILTVLVDAVAVVYGQAIPALTGSLTGVLAQDGGRVSLALTTTATVLAAPGVYPISAALTGPSAGNYTVTAGAGAVTISKAPSAVTVGVPATAFAPPAISVHVSSGTAGVPTGTVLVLDGTSRIGAISLNAKGDGVLTPVVFALGSHTLTAVYQGDADFVGSSSGGAIVTISPGAAPDFSLAATGQTSLTLAKGGAAAFSFAVAPVSGGLASPIVLSASGLPAGATASFNPAVLPPGGAVSAFILTVQTVKAANVPGPLVPPTVILVVITVGTAYLAGKRRFRGWKATVFSTVIATVVTVAFAVGCGARVNSTVPPEGTTQTYTITVNGTGTSAGGGVVVHSAQVILVLY